MDASQQPSGRSLTARPSGERIVRRGARGAYSWVTVTGDVYMGTLLRLSPEIVLNHHLAVTALDGGVRTLTSAEREAGWRIRSEIAYSPLIGSTDALQFQRDGLDAPGYDEWYVFKAPHELGETLQGNPFVAAPDPKRLLIFVQQLAFVLHSPDAVTHDFHDWFWKQMEWIEPESYISDGRDCLTLVSRDRAMLDRFVERLAAEMRP